MNAIKIGLASALALATAMPAIAQPYQPTDQYRRDSAQYQSDRANYEARRADYAQARADYERRRADWQRARTAYDQRWGYGSYIRAYGPEPTWDDAYWAGVNDGYNGNAGAYGRDSAYSTVDCRQRSNNNQVAGGLIGAIAGAAIGSNVAARNARTEGAVLGAVLGGALGANVGKSTAKCDASGYYYTFDQTRPYRESAYDRRTRSGQYDYSYYSRQRCRLAPATLDGDRDGYAETRYVRVCPDGSGRYRVTG